MLQSQEQHEQRRPVPRRETSPAIGGVGRCSGVCAPVTEAETTAWPPPPHAPEAHSEDAAARRERRVLRPGGTATDAPPPPPPLPDDDDESQPFMERFAAESAAWQSLSDAKETLRGSSESVWRARDLPSCGFTEQFLGCMRELDAAADGALSAAGGAATFLDIGAAPGGFSLHLLGRGLRGVGVTLRPQPGAHDVRRGRRTGAAALVGRARGTR